MHLRNDHQAQSDAIVLKSPDSDLIGDGTGILIIDDLVDSGRTLEIVRKISFLMYPIIPESSLKELSIFDIGEKKVESNKSNQ